MANSRTDVYVISVVKGRTILQAAATLLAVVGLIVLGHEIAVWVLTVKQIGYISNAQIVATFAALAAVIAGFAAFSPSKLGAPLITLRRNFIISAVFSLIAAALLIATLVLFGNYIWAIWAEANNTSYAPHGYYGSYHNDIGVIQPYGPYPHVNPGYIRDYFYYYRVVAILKLVAFIADVLLAAAAVLVFVLSIVNVLGLRASHVPLPGQEVIHVQQHGGRNEVFYENTPRTYTQTTVQQRA